MPKLPKTFLLSQIKKRIDPEKDLLIIDGDFAVICDVEQPHRIKMMFKKAKQRYVQIDLEEIVNFITSKLEPEVDVKRWLKERILLYSTPEEIMELKERLQKAPKIKPAPLCYSLMIGGKRGHAFEFNLIG